MGWEATGQPTVRRQRTTWVVRVDGSDTETGRPRPRQLGTYATQRAALAAARSLPLQERTGTLDTVSWLVRGHVAARTDPTLRDKEHYRVDIRLVGLGLGGSSVVPFWTGASDEFGTGSGAGLTEERFEVLLGGAG